MKLRSTSRSYCARCVGTGAARRERLEGGPGGEDARLHGVVDALERRHVNEPRRVAHQEEALAVPPLRQRVEAALGNRLRAPLQQLAALEIAPEERMQLHPLEQLVHVERCVVVVQPNDQPDRDLARPERIHEAAAERVSGERPAQRVDDAIQRPLDLPHLLHPEREDLGIRGPHLLPLAPGLRRASHGSLPRAP